MVQLKTYAKNKFYQLVDDYRIYISRLNGRYRNQYYSIVSNGDTVSKHLFTLPADIKSRNDKDSGNVKIQLNAWEEDVLKEEQNRPDFVTWLRITPRASWALCILYKQGNEQKAMFPDFLIVRRDEKLGYVFDILEPPNPSFDDNLPKAKGLAEYAKENIGISRIVLIRKSKDITRTTKYLRLNLSKSAICEKVLNCITNDEFNHIFETEGTFNE